MHKEEKIFQVSEFNEFIDVYLRQAGEVIVEGELSEINISQGKWVYATIKDEKASVGIWGTIFQITNTKQLEQGMQVHVYGPPGLYQKTGRFSIQAYQIIPVGEGALQAMFDKLRVQLDSEGLFAEERKRKVSRFPENIGLITAKDSQAYKDFVKILSERMGGIKINFYPVNVQGKNSVSSIIKAFDHFNKNFHKLDAVVMVRGGGSLEDLISFNDEAVVRAIFSSKFPVVCGVGHEGDVSLADMAADLRASTPSNAAELLTRERLECIKDVNFSISRIENLLLNNINDKKNRVRQSLNIIEHNIKDKVSSINILINKFENEIRFSEQKVIKAKERIDERMGKILIHAQNELNTQSARLNYMIRILKNMDHRRLLERGFSITMSIKGKIIKQIADVEKNSDIETVLSDGKIRSVVTKSF